MEQISVFDIFKIGIGPSSSHTLGPWNAARSFIRNAKSRNLLSEDCRLSVDLYGSLALTGKGHGTDIAIIMGLSDFDPSNTSTEQLEENISRVNASHLISLKDIVSTVRFDPTTGITFHYTERLPLHSNGMKFRLLFPNNEIKFEATYYSVGGGFIVNQDSFENEEEHTEKTLFPYPIQSGKELISYCTENGKSITEIILENERTLRNDEAIRKEIEVIWNAMLESVYRGCHTEGVLPGGLEVVRRAHSIYRRHLPNRISNNAQDWFHALGTKSRGFAETLDLVSCFAMAVNEENASFGRIVTAPTNGAAGVIPAVMLYHLRLSEADFREDDILDFLLVAGEIGSLFKKGATISAAAGGCQAEIGVSSAMAAGALTYVNKGSADQCLMAAEIAMEHHLGLTCDPVGGLVQVPCIERNSIGAIKAITASNIALNSDPEKARVFLDDVISTMWQTAKDMNDNYKETSLGGLATTVRLPEC